MYYWNKQNFEGLLAIAKEFKNREGYELFSEYCLLKEKGLKKQAVKIINEFVSQLKNSDFQNQRQVAVCLAELSFWNTDVHHLLSHPLQVYITETLKKWCATEEQDAPYTWLGYMTGEDEHFKSALKYNPEDQVALSRLALSALDDVDFQTHHLSESLFLGDEKTAIEKLKIAQQYINVMQQSEAKIRLANDLKEYEQLVCVWLEFASDKERKGKGSFPEWSAEHGNNFSFRTTIYYDV